jgi:two-component system response regulator HydG
MTGNQVKEAVKILVVDDQAGIRISLKGILSKKGYQVTVAESGEEALERVKQEDFRVVFMDVKMPGLSGVDTFLKMKEICPKTSVIMMTAYAIEEEIKRAIRGGAYAVIYKPFEMDRILSIVDECLENRTLVLVVDDLVEYRALLKTILEKKGHRVVDVDSGEECLKQIKERKFQIILLDQRLPGINGVETLKQVKEIRPDVSVVMITGFSAEQMVQDAVNSGSYALLNKPVDVTQLLSIVDECLVKEKGEKND